jgi:hypothetical protein
MSGNGVAARNSVPEPWPSRRSLRPLAVPLATFTVAAASVSALTVPTPSLPLARGGRRSSRRRRSEAEAAQMGPQIVGLATGAAPRSGPLPHSRPWRYRRERRGALRCVRATPLAPQWCLGPCRRLSHHRACLRVSFRWRRCSARQSPLRQGRALDVASQKRAGRTAPWLRLSESPCRSVGRPAHINVSDGAPGVEMRESGAVPSTVT